MNRRWESWQVRGMALAVGVALLAIGFGSGQSLLASGDNGPRGTGTGRGSVTLAPGLAGADEAAPQLPVVPDGPQALVMAENFEGAWPAGRWRAFDNDGLANGEYYWENRCTGFNSNRSAWAFGAGASGIRNSCTSYYPPHANSWAVWGPVDLSQASAASLSFQFWVDSECVGSQCSAKSDRLWALASSDGRVFDGRWWAGNWNKDPSAVQGWVSDSLDLSRWLGESQVWIAFRFASDGSVSYPGGAFIDNVTLNVDSCPATAFVRGLTTDRSCYTPGAQMGVLVDLGTSLASQRVDMQTDLASFDILWASDQRTVTAPGQVVVPLTVPTTLSPNVYTIRVTLWDASSKCYQTTREMTVRVDPVCGTVTPPVPVTPTPTATPPAAPPCPAAGAVDVVFAMDTSGSMDDEFASLCTQIAAVVSRLQSQGITVSYRIVGISQTRDCAPETVTGLVPGGTVNDSEDWAPAVVDLSGGYPWQAGRTRLIVPMSDEGPEDGDPVNDPGDDRDAITAAIAAARANNVIVSPVLGSGFSSGTENLARDLAAGTGGRVFLSSDPSQDLADGVANLIGTAACTPIITAVAPECDVAAGTIVTITGANFLPGATVTIGGFTARDVTVISSNQIQCRIDPTMANGTYDVTVTNPPGGWSFTLPDSLTVGPCAAGCGVPRPEVSPVCPGPDYVRNGYYESGGRSWGQLSTSGRSIIGSDLAPQGFFAAHFEGPMGLAADEWLYQYIEVPPDATGASFWVDDEAHGVSKVASPPAASGLDFFRVSLYDLTLGREVVRLWEFDPLSQCPIDPPAYNLSVAELDLIRGRRVALALRLRKVTTTGWATLVVVDGVHFTVCAPSPPCRVENDKTAAPRVVRGGDEVTVMLSLTGIEGACLVQRQPADVALVVDRSGSMSGQKMWDAKSAAKAFIDRLQLSRDQVALVSFADSAALDSGLTRTAGPVRGAVDRLNAAGSTNIEEALRMAQGELASGRHGAGNQPVLILMSDGRPTGGDPRAAADAAKAAGTRVFAIGLGTDVDPDLMRAIASSPADYFFAPDSSQLDGIYQQIAGVLGGSPATNITVIDTLSPYVTLVPNSFGGAVPAVSPDGKTLTWSLPRLGFETRFLTYRVTMTDVGGTWPTNQVATATYTNSAGQPGVLTFPIPQVTVIPEAQGRPELACRDNESDDGTVPSNPRGEAWWDSPDIWVRNQPDGIQAHQQPLAGQTNYIYVRVRNLGDGPASDVTVHVYDAPGAASIRWPDDWAPEIGTATIPTLPAGATTVVSVPYRPLSGGHTCFLTRIESPDDGITNDGWVPFDNNICQRNVQITGPETGTSGVGAGNRQRGSGYGSVVIRSQNFPATGTGPLSLGGPVPQQEPPGVKVLFADPGLFQRWVQAGGSVTGGQVVSAEAAVVLDVQDRGGKGTIDARLDRIPFEDEETSQLRLEVTVPPGADPPTIDLVQLVDGEAVGGNVLRPEVKWPHRLFLPQLMRGKVLRSVWTAGAVPLAQ